MDEKELLVELVNRIYVKIYGTNNPDEVYALTWVVDEIRALRQMCNKGKVAIDMGGDLFTSDPIRNPPMDDKTRSHLEEEMKNITFKKLYDKIIP